MHGGLPFNSLRLTKTQNHLSVAFSRVFNSWTLHIRNASTPHGALQIFTRMHRCSIPTDTHSALFTLKAATLLKNLSVARHLQAHVTKVGIISDVYVGTALLHGYAVMNFKDACVLFDEMPDRNLVTWHTMITGYARAGKINKARGFFEKMPERDVGSWGSMIAAYIGSGNLVEGLTVCRKMLLSSGLVPDQPVMGSVLSACARLGSGGLVVGKSVHAFMTKYSWELNVQIGTLLVDMYAKCGFLKNSMLVFNLMRDKNVMTWTSLICGLAQHGYGIEALSVFREMQDEGVRPNEVTFTGILSACAQAGLVDEGQKYFNMLQRSQLETRIHHYGCMVDLLGKAGHLEDAYNIIKTMRIEPNDIIWSSFLVACKLHKRFDMAERVFEQTLRTVRPENEGGLYSLICDLYVLAGKWDDAERIRDLMTNQSVKKNRGSSFV